MSNFFSSAFRAAARSMTRNITGNVGVFWGSFDPPSLVHNNIIKAAVAALNPEQIDFVIGSNYFNKEKVYALASTREKMLFSMLSTHEKSIATFTHDYTGQISDIMQDMKAKYPEGQLTFIVGQTDFEKHFATLKELDNIAVAVTPRGNYKAIERLQQRQRIWPNKIILLPYDEQYLQLSSQIIKNALYQKQNSMNKELLENILHPNVLQIIKEEGLYNNPQSPFASKGMRFSKK